jgi:hypothetical protein
MDWQFYTKADTNRLSATPWTPSNVFIAKKLVNNSGEILTDITTTLEDALTNCTDLPALAADYLSVVRSHFDIQYDLIFTSRDEPHPSPALAFGQILSSCIRVYRALLNNDLGEI